MGGIFTSLRIRNYRLWAAGALVSNIGTWMQRTAQDWLVLTQLTHHNATSVGVITALQFGPQLLCLPLSGAAADRFDKRKLMMITQAVSGLLALVLGALTLSGLVQLWHVYLLAFLLGCASAFDAPARQAFVSEIVGEADLANAVGLNSTSFNAARLLGPSAAGILIAALGTGWAFIINAASFAAMMAALLLLRTAELHPAGRAPAGARGLGEGFAYVRRRPDLQAIMLMICLIGTFGLNYPIFISTMSVTAFHAGPNRFGWLTSMMAVGSVTGALLAARRRRPRPDLLFIAAAIFGGAYTVAAFMPNYWSFGAALVVVGVSAQTLTTTAASTVQLTTEPMMRGRVMAILLAVALGGMPVGAPIVGWVADRFGPRCALGVAAASGFAAALIGSADLWSWLGRVFVWETRTGWNGAIPPRPPSNS